MLSKQRESKKVFIEEIIFLYFTIENGLHNFHAIFTFLFSFESILSLKMLYLISTN